MADEQIDSEQVMQEAVSSMFEVYKAGWLGSLVWDCFQQHKPISSEMLPPDEVIKISFDAYLETLVDQVDVIGMVKVQINDLLIADNGHPWEPPTDEGSDPAVRGPGPMA